MHVRVKPVYEAPDEHDGLRIFIDTSWPHGVDRSAAELDHWITDLTLPECAPRKFASAPDPVAAATAAFTATVRDRPGFEELLSLLETGQTVTLLHGPRQFAHDQVLILASIVRDAHASRQGR